MPDVDPFRWSSLDWHFPGGRVSVAEFLEQYTNLLDWPANTVRYRHRDGHPGQTSRIPLVQNLLVHHDFVQYYPDHVEHLLSTEFTPAAIVTRMGTTNAAGLWQRVSQSAYLEALATRPSVHRQAIHQ